MIIKKKESESIAIASKFLQEEKLIIIPTDTIYGFSGIMGSKAEDSLYKIKQRDKDKKLIYLIAHPSDLYKYIDTKFYTSEELEYLTSFWPAALTIIFKALAKEEKDSDTTIAFRCPKDTWLRTLIASVARPIFSTSANISGKPTITNVQELEMTFGSALSIVVDEDARNKLSSTILDASKRPFSVVRQGAFAIE